MFFGSRKCLRDQIQPDEKYKQVFLKRDNTKIGTASIAARKLDTAESLPGDVMVAIGQVFEPAGLHLTEMVVREAESAEYGAARFALNGHKVVFRTAKTTPTKLGQFVTIWKRPTPDGDIAPLDSRDGIAFVLVGVSDAMHKGLFVFDQAVLVAKGVFSSAGEGGKRAMRVYPPWVQLTAKAAIVTQRWQCRYFISLDQDGTVDVELLRRLFNT